MASLEGKIIGIAPMIVISFSDTNDSRFLKGPHEIRP